MTSPANIHSPRFAANPVAAPIGPVLIARALRDFGDGFVAVLLPVYLTALGLGAFEVGVVATAALFGSALITLGIGHLGARVDQRLLLICASALMIATGCAFAVSSTYAVILLVAFAGTINPSSGTVSIFAPLEQAVLSRSVADADRTRMFARYSLIGAMSSAAGALSAAVPDVLVDAGIGRVTAFKLMFCCYGVLGLLAAALYRRLRQSRAEQHHASTPLGPSRGMVYKLAALFSLDAFAGGFVVQSLLALWLFKRFGISLSAASLFFFWTSVLSALSYPLASWLARRIGLVNTMVFTHIPSSVFLILAAFSPNLYVALGLLLLRSALSQMDVPTRTSYVMAVVTPAERPAAASVTAVPRSLASAISPAIAGALLTTAFSGLPLVVCGTLKIAYDLALLFSFRHVKPPEET